MRKKIVLCLFTAFILVCLSSSCNILDQSKSTPEETDTADNGSQDSSDKDNGDTEVSTSGDGEIDNADDLSDQIIVTYPMPDQLITSPLTITGEARGTWFFEANFSVSLLDSNENVLALHYAETDEEWMTQDFISFISTIEFDDPETATGFLILEKNNPSDLREHDAQLIIPVRFK